MGEIGFNFDYLSPTGSVGMIIIIIGVIFSGLMGMVFYKVNNDSDSLRDKERKKEIQNEQRRKISRLYPKKMTNEENKFK
tara:strand:+ start:338 stop:577 length:240 start_codon:yes stop_codon:yes gene_type:complete